MWEINCEAALNLAREYYGDNEIKQKDVPPTEPVDFERTEKHHNNSLKLYESKKDSRKDSGPTWWLVYSKV